MCEVFSRHADSDDPGKEKIPSMDPKIIKAVIGQQAPLGCLKEVSIMPVFQLGTDN